MSVMLWSLDLASYITTSVLLGLATHVTQNETICQFTDLGMEECVFLRSTSGWRCSVIVLVLSCMMV